MASDAFVACGILYAVRSVYQDDDSEAGGDLILYAYDTRRDAERPRPHCVPKPRTSTSRPSATTPETTSCTCGTTTTSLDTSWSSAPRSPPP
ncbi:hypothetical protein MHYP_G00105040, partial [Metynnis hypsauchen]